MAVLALGAVAAAWAQAQAEERPQARELDAVRVTTTVLPATAGEAIHSVTVLGPEQLAPWRGRSLAEVLAAQAGLVLDRSARGGGFGALYLRGADPSHVVVLVDGVRQNDPLSSRGSAVDLNTLSLEQVERIEIVRGAASVAHAEAIAGVVHVHTRRPASGASAGAAVGGDGLRAVHAVLSGDGWRLAASDRSDGDGDIGSHDLRALDASWAGELRPALSIRAAAGYGDSVARGFPDDSGGPRHAVLRELEEREARTRHVSLQAEWRPALGAVEAQWAWFARDGAEDSPGVAGGVRDPVGLPALAARTGYRRDELQATWRSPLGARGELAVGILHQRERGRYDGRIDYGVFRAPVAFAMERNTGAAFAELRWRHAGWTAQGGLRLERRSDGDTGHVHASQPMLSLQRRLAGGWHWGASYSRSSRPPSFYALGHPLVGNPSLRQERAEHREAYVATDDDAAWPSRFTLFSARYRDLVDFDAGPPPRLVNRARIEADGLEWRSSHRFGNDWRLGLDGTWMRVRDPAGGAILRHRPRLQAGADLLVPVGGAELSLRLQHLGRRFDSAIPTGDRWLDRATTLDVAIRRPVGPAMLLLSLDDATDSRGEEVIGLDTPGRRLRLSLQWSLE
ncbi:TonB-dependent receptor [Luteimonas sp. J29]|uniref:TonB-dependent receptor plug domain-containing protein n=1 Tax=Luteimonas sp. J29 TaxID=935863 RepID=UPI00047E767B|nr:TonB-dependent receptor [Luteimonas sp. J29]